MASAEHVDSLHIHALSDKTQLTPFGVEDEVDKLGFPQREQ